MVLCLLNLYNESSDKETTTVDQKCAWSSLKDWSMRSTNKDLPGLITFQMSGGYSKRALFGTMWILSFLYGFSRLDLLILNHKCFLTKCAPQRDFLFGQAKLM